MDPTMEAGKCLDLFGKKLSAVRPNRVGVESVPTKLSPYCTGKCLNAVGG
jgi:hypothetical protein